MNEEKEKKYTDFVPVEKMHNMVIPEDFPEGAYGSPPFDRERLGKSTPFGKDQKPYSAFTYETRQLHEDMPRQDPGSHPTHDEKTKDTEQPYHDV